MASLQYRGSKVNSSEKAVAKPNIASYRGSTYNPNETHYHAQHIAKTYSYRGAKWEA